MGSGHGHEVTATGEHRKRLIVVLVITGAVLIAEVIGGLIAGSLALLADAGHMLTDSTGLILALIAASLATRAATARRTFGLQRAEVLAALGNALLLVAVGRLGADPGRRSAAQPRRDRQPPDARRSCSSACWPTWPDCWCSARRRPRA